MTSTEVKFDGEAVQRVFGVPRDVIKGTVVGAMDVMEERKSEGLAAIRRPDEIWPIGRALARLASTARTSLIRTGGISEPWGVLENVLGDNEPKSPLLRRLWALTMGRGSVGFPALTPETTVIAWGVRDTGEVNLEVRSLVETPVVRGLVTLAVMDDMGEMMLDRLGDRAERLSEALRRAFDDRAIKLLGTCACSWMSEKLGDEFEEWWNEGGGWRALYRVVRKSELVESTVKERTGIEPGK
ncbi:hypothetical protein [Methanopyrus sp. SNP6]|uniref:hypothetical protein n=1 Tax=Methanopyrus sp. SNP6 TaxID=1937005 RepID=UPI0011E60202|nr:hypothetical protein [Methanopyrus sp. SNP6]